MWQAAFTLTLGFVLTVVIGGAYASYLQRRSWEHQNQSRLDEEERKQATDICTALSESIDKRRDRLWRLLEAIEKRAQGDISADELRDRRSECEEALPDWNDQLTKRLVSVGVYFGEDLRDHLREAVDKRFREASDGIEKLYRLVAASTGAAVGGIDPGSVGSAKASLDEIRDGAYALSFAMMRRIGNGEIGRNKPVAEDEFDEDDEDERAGHTRRWVRYVMPVMVEVDCDTDEITSVVTLPGEARLDRDDTMDLCIYDEKFRRRPFDGQAQTRALAVSEPQWQYPGLMVGRPVNWPDEAWQEDYFPRDADDDAYAEAHLYADGDQDD